MASLTVSEMEQIVNQQREAGVERLSSHFMWSDFCDERRIFHQEFVYDVTMFAATCGFRWPDVIQASVAAKRIFPQLIGIGIPQLLSLLRDVLSECLPNLSPVHLHEFIQFLTKTCVPRWRLFQAVMSGAVNMPDAQLHLEVQLPPTPCPLAQGMDRHEWECRRHQAEITSKLLQMEEKLKALRRGSRVALEIDVPEDEQLDEEEVPALVHAAVRAAQHQVRESLTQEASLLGDILQLKLQQVALAAGGHQNPVPSHTD